MNRLQTLLDWLRTRIWFLAFIVTFAVLMYPRVRNLVLGVEVTPAERGYQVAMNAGCFNCHGPNGMGGVKNPGSADGEVPGFAGGTPMMWVKNEQELREYVLNGAPARKLADPRYKKEMEAQLLAMPAYRNYLSHRQVDDLIVYLRAVSGLITPTDELAAARAGAGVPLRLLQLPRTDGGWDEQEHRLTQGLHPGMVGQRLPRSGA